MNKKDKIIGYYNEEKDIFLCKDCFQNLQSQEGFKEIRGESLQASDYACGRCGKDSNDYNRKANLVQRRILASLLLLGGIFLMGNIGDLYFMIGGLISVVLSAIILDNHLINFVTKTGALFILLSSFLFVYPMVLSLIAIPLIAIFATLIIELLVIVSAGAFWKRKSWSLYFVVAYLLATSGYSGYWIYAGITEDVRMGLAGIIIIPVYAFHLALFIFFLAYFLKIWEEFK